jgi:hypothetical protein
MNPSKPTNPPAKADAPPISQPPVKPKKNLDLDPKKILAKAKKYWQKFATHLPFVAVMLVLLVYLFVVWQIRGLVAAEPSAEAESAALSSTNIPKIDKKAIDEIQSLEQNSPQVRALFNEARNNPFQE